MKKTDNTTAPFNELCKKIMKVSRFFLVGSIQQENRDLLIEYDRYMVKAGGKTGVLITRHLIDMDTDKIIVLYEHAEGYSKAPADIQKVIDTIKFTKYK